MNILGQPHDRVIVDSIAQSAWGQPLDGHVLPLVEVIVTQVPPVVVVMDPLETEVAE